MASQSWGETLEKNIPTMKKSIWDYQSTWEFLNLGGGGQQKTITFTADCCKRNHACGCMVDARRRGQANSCAGESGPDGSRGGVCNLTGEKVEYPSLWTRGRVIN